MVTLMSNERYYVVVAFVDIAKKGLKMKHVLNALCAVVLLAVGFIAISSAAATADVTRNWKPFVKDKYYLGDGGIPPTLAELAADPREYFRSEEAYLVFKSGFEARLGLQLEDAAFAQILTSDGVRLTSCQGIISTNGIDILGNTKKFERRCYMGEKLIQVKVDDKWHTVASQGCLNQVFAMRAIQPKPTKPKPKPAPAPVAKATPVPGSVFANTGTGQMLPRPRVVVQETVGIHVHTDDCGHSIYLPGYRAGVVFN